MRGDRQIPQSRLESPHTDQKEPAIRVLLVEPNYYTRYPPLGLLKLSAMHKFRGDQVYFDRKVLASTTEPPDLIYITSLFTYSWKPVHDAVAFYREAYPDARIILGGIYATLMPEHANLAGADEVRIGLVSEAEGFLPDYSLVPEWDSSIMFSMRGCIRKCAFCAVPRLEGKTTGKAQGIGDLIEPRHKKAILWDNNVLGVPNWKDVIDELVKAGVSVDFNQGLDARLITQEIANQLAMLRIPIIRMAYDIPSESKAVEKAIGYLESAGFNRRKIVVYTLYNFTDTPSDFFARVFDLISWGVVSYPMRYEPLNSLKKNKYVSPHWTPTQLEMLAVARRVLGAGGAFPPYRGLIEKFNKSTSFEEAFSIRDDENRRRKRTMKMIAGVVEEQVNDLSKERTAFRDLYNDPMTLAHPVVCANCQSALPVGERAFPVQSYAGSYLAYICSGCHPNRKWINGLWRSVLREDFTLGNTQQWVIPVLTKTVH